MTKTVYGHLCTVSRFGFRPPLKLSGKVFLLKAGVRVFKPYARSYMTFKIAILPSLSSTRDKEGRISTGSSNDLVR